jgi:hypothetical protein
MFMCVVHLHLSQHPTRGEETREERETELNFSNGGSPSPAQLPQDEDVQHGSQGDGEEGERELEPLETPQEHSAVDSIANV